MRTLTDRAARRLILGAALLGSFTGSAAPGAAQDALMTSASGVPRGGYLLTAYPLLIPSGQNEVGFFLRGSRGVTERLAAHASLGVYNDLTYLGAMTDLRLPRRVPVDLSLSLGIHYSAFDEGQADILGLDLALVGHHAIAPGLALYGGFDLDLERPEAPYDSFARGRFVAGIETAVRDRMRLLVEGGLGVNDRSPHYLSVGFAVRLR